MWGFEMMYTFETTNGRLCLNANLLITVVRISVFFVGTSICLCVWKPSTFNEGCIFYKYGGFQSNNIKIYYFVWIVCFCKTQTKTLDKIRRHLWTPSIMETHCLRLHTRAPSTPWEAGEGDSCRGLCLWMAGEGGTDYPQCSWRTARFTWVTNSSVWKT